MYARDHLPAATAGIASWAAPPLRSRGCSTKSANIRLTPCHTPERDDMAAAKKPSRKSFAADAP